MSLSDKFRNIVTSQKQLTKEFEGYVDELSLDNVFVENERLKNELNSLQITKSSLENRVVNIKQENAELKNALYEQIYNEKLAIIKATDSRLNALFTKDVQIGFNSLSKLEIELKLKMQAMRKNLERHRIDLSDELYGKIYDLEIDLNKKIALAKDEYAANYGAFSQNQKDEFAKLKDEQITEETIKSIAKKNNLEAFFGLNILNILGILLIIIGVVTASQYTIFKLSNEIKGILMFIFGGGLLVAGELLNRKKPNVFSLGLTSGGVAVLYISTAVSFFTFEILGMYPALALCILITAVSFVLSQRYNSQTVAAFALIGGYLPLFSIDFDISGFIYGAMVYFLILNTLALLISVYRKWLISEYIGFVLSVISSGIILISTFSLSAPDFGMEKIIVILYLVLTFVVYTLIPIFSSYAEKRRFKSGDTILLGLNTFISALFIYIAFSLFGLDDFYGLLAIIFAVVYLALGKLIETKFKSEDRTKALFYLTGLSFVVLIVPFQFGIAWLSLGWLAEGLALSVYGILRQDKTFKKVGYIICGLCLGAFLIFDVMSAWRYLYDYKYFAITLGSIMILAAHIYKNTLSHKFESVYKYFVIINAWLYILCFVNNPLQRFFLSRLTNPSVIGGIFTDYLFFSLAITLTFLFAYGVSRLRKLADSGIKTVCVIIYILGILGFVMNSGTDYIFYAPYGEVPMAVNIVGTAILILIGLLSIFAVRDVLLYFVMDLKLGVEWYPLIISLYFVFVLSQNLIVQYGLEFENAAISIIYVVTAFGLIVFGFVKRYSLIRKFGIALSILSVAKLFLIDLSFLRDVYKIMSYFALGGTLVAISFVYQYFSKRLELKAEVIEK